VSSYIKLIIFIVVLLLISVAVVFIDSSMDNINQSMPKISDGIVQGDKDYNESVELLNNRNFDESNQKAISAGNNYNNSLHELEKIRDKYDKDLKDVHKDYIDTTINELELKLKAVDELKEAIYYLEMYYNYTGSTHGTEANDLMHGALKYQNERNEIVQENPELFN
jgi:gamma-glutamyl phosphate reductase